MKTSCEIYRAGIGTDPELIGKVWTDGKTVFISPESEMMMSILDSVAVDVLGNSYPPKTNPVGFVKWLHNTWRGRIYATESVRQ